MFNILEAPFMIEMIRTITNMYAHGWDERNGGNVSLLLEEEAIKDYVDLEAVIRTIDIPFDATDLIGKYFLVTGTGKYLMFSMILRKIWVFSGSARMVIQQSFSGAITTAEDLHLSSLLTL